MKDFIDHTINDVEFRIEYYLDEGSEGTRDVPPTGDTLEIDSINFNGMNVMKVFLACDFDIDRLQFELLEILSK